MPSYGWEGFEKMQKDPCYGDQISHQPSLGFPAWTQKGLFLCFIIFVLHVNQEKPIQATFSSSTVNK